MARIDSFLRVAVDQRGSDLHLHAGKAPTVRLDGELIPLPFRTLTDLEARRFLYEILDPVRRAQLESRKQLDLVHTVPGVGRFRVNAFFQRDGLSAVFRVVPDRVPQLDDLLLPPSVRELSRLPNGLVLVTGPTGSGKTTTMAAMIHEINRTSPRHIITLEDPVEFIHRRMMAAITQREVGRDVESFATGLKSALREAPDVLMVGELRDPETVSLALQAAETGVLVLGTLHTRSAAAAPERILDSVPEGSREQARSVLSVLLRGVIAQRLCRRAWGEGRIAALEILMQSHAASAMIREGKAHQLDALVKSPGSENHGTLSLDRCLLRYVREGLIDRQEALEQSDDPEAMMQRLLELREPDHD